MATRSRILAWRISQDRGAWWSAVHGVAKSWTWLRDATTREEWKRKGKREGISIQRLTKKPKEAIYKTEHARLYVAMWWGPYGAQGKQKKLQQRRDLARGQSYGNDPYWHLILSISGCEVSFLLGPFRENIQHILRVSYPSISLLRNYQKPSNLKQQKWTLFQLQGPEKYSEDALRVPLWPETPRGTSFLLPAAGGFLARLGCAARVSHLCLAFFPLSVEIQVSLGLFSSYKDIKDTGFRAHTKLRLI